MTRFILMLLALLAASPALAGGPPVTLYDVNNQAIGTSANPIMTAPATGAASAATVNQGAAGASPWPVVAPDAVQAGTIAAGTVGSAYTIPVNDQGTARFRVSGLAATGATLQAQYTADGGTMWEPIAILRPPLAYGTTVTADGQYEVKASATTGLRLIVTAAGTAGTVSVASVLSQTQGLVGIVGSLPPGTNAIGSVALGTTDAGNLAAVASRTPALGQATKAASQPVVIASDQGPLTVTPNACTITQSVVALSAGVSTQIAGANPNRKSLRWMDVGANPMTVAAGTAAAVANQGINYAAGTGAQASGGSESFFGDGIPTNAFQAISTSGTSVTVWECQ